MLFLDPAHLPAGPLMGVDPGSKTLGIAVCNSARTLVTPLTTIQRTKFTADAQALLALYDERGCTGLVVGLPLHMDGGDGRRAQSSRSFVTNLLRVRDLPVVYQDERLSTFAAGERLLEAGVKHAGHKARIDAEAAAIILSNAIDAIEAAGDEAP
ncbi:MULTISPECIES: Holliday junction resolvase RuvX [Marinicauda]|jgi:putative Holliday junction resolvase|uniref:Putative pre-16S rRNA nuclease n=1 Tax=Marinicauda pacifica TaxID=1133559 RepID=A0A4S2H7P9_9PROT|nr:MULTISPECIES: Holliday junction resolvase RuvX [Marinicauda]TGY91845.1 Holliday junction resolvase RuvX [Marinicauda pacifica]